MKTITIFADGACSGNPGKGGFGTLIRYNDHTKTLSQGYLHTTNNRMELRGIIAGLQSLKEQCEVTVVTDSQYVVNAFTKGWLKSWKQKGWRKADKGPVQNVDLWKKLDALVAQHNVTFTWIRGHNGHTENELCDELAVAATASKDLIEDRVD